MRYTIYCYTRVHPNLVQDTSVVEGSEQDALNKLESIKKDGLFYEIDDNTGKVIYKNY